MAKIFINYRREDSEPYAGRLYDRLMPHFGEDHVFRDIDQIEPGEDFVEVINEKLRVVQAAVVLIGKQWLNIKDTSGERRLDNPDDWVRLEITALLERNIRVIPVLVGGAMMPNSMQLPECLIPLARRNALEISDQRFHTDVDKLIRTLEKILDAQQLEKRLAATERPREVRLSFEPEMVRISPGKFLMGSKDGELNEQPIHEVIIGYAFEIGKYAVTFDEYDAFARATGCALPNDCGWGRGKRPVINVSWHDAQGYVKWLSDKTSKRYRLSSEAEWEYAAKAGLQTRYWWGDDIGKNNANCKDCGNQWDGKQTVPVGSFKANAFGLYDTAGNVWEWTQDCWHHNYANAPTDGSAWLEKDEGDCKGRVVRGGSWDYDPLNLRSAGRGRYGTDDMNNNLGFRVARDL